MKAKMCGICNGVCDPKNSRTIFGEIHVCVECIYRILSLYVYSFPIRLLCPFCQNHIGKVSCLYCNVSRKMEQYKYENI